MSPEETAAAARGPSSTGGEPVTEPPITQQAPLEDAQIAAISDAANGGEVEQAKLALMKAKNPRVKKFAQMIDPAPRPGQGRSRKAGEEAEVVARRERRVHAAPRRCARADRGAAGREAELRPHLHPRAGRGAPEGARAARQDPDPEHEGSRAARAASRSCGPRSRRTSPKHARSTRSSTPTRARTAAAARRPRIARRSSSRARRRATPPAAAASRSRRSLPRQRPVNGAVERAEPGERYPSSAFTLAAQMKSFSLRPPTSWVL